MTTVNQIRDWLGQASREHTHMLVVCDTYDYDDYPVYTDDVSGAIKKYKAASMQKIMEVYDLSMSHEEQLKPGIRVWNAPKEKS